MSNLSILQNNSVLTMTSLEIAELVGSRHDSVKRTIERLWSAKSISQPSPMVAVRNSQGQTVAVFEICKRDSYVIVAQLSPEFTAKLVDRWQELESKIAQPAPQFKIPQNFAEALRLAADQQEIIQQQAAQIEQSKPMLLVYDALANRRMDCNTTTLAKQLGTTATKLNTFLKSSGVKFKHQDLPMATHSDWFNVVTGVAKNGYETIQCLITPLGQIEIAKLWSEK